ncbi:MAG: fatty acid desaturase [Bacteriovoracaceae bacterium]
MKASTYFNPKNIEWPNTLFILLTPLIAVISVAYYLSTEAWNWPIFWVAFFFYWASGFGITAGYHRLFAHKTYKANALVRFLLAIFGAIAFQNSILKWASDHRRHHHKVDSDDDPYTITEGFFYAHMGWILLKEKKNSHSYIKDLGKDPLVLWQHKYYIPIAVGFGIVLPTLIGGMLGSYLGGFALIAMARIVLVHHFTFFINSLCHMWGNRPYSRIQTARDNGLISLFTFGEGYHNYHHEFQTDYRNGLRWWQYDPTKWLIFSLSKIGFTWGLKRIPEAKIEAAKMQVLTEKLRSSQTDLSEEKESLVESLDSLKEKIISLHRSLSEKTQELKSVESGSIAADDIKSIKLKIDELSEQLKSNIKSWYQTYDMASQTA